MTRRNCRGYWVGDGKKNHIRSKMSFPEDEFAYDFAYVRDNKDPMVR